jgi:type II secretory pathway pseudopilin PulG
MAAPQKRTFIDNVRIGPLSVLAVVGILCMSVLAVLSVSTSNASLVIAQRQANAISDSYLAERAAQDFVASLDEELAKAGASGGAAPSMSSLEGALPDISRHAQEAADGLVLVNATIQDGVVHADFACSGARALEVEVSAGSDGRPHVSKWAMTAIRNVEEPAGALWTGA